MINFTVRTDCHVHDKAPQSRTDDYLQTCLASLRQIGEHAAYTKSVAVLDNGDFFHAKSASKNSHLMVRSVIDLHKEFYPCPVYCNPGNHDFPYNNIEYIDRQPLGVLFAAGIFERMYDHTFEDEDGLKVRVVGFPYKQKFTIAEFDLPRGDEDILIVCAHTFASPQGGDFFGNEVALSYYDLAECSPDMMIFGHWHIDQGIQEVNGKIFMNLGSMTRGSLVKDNLSRIPRFGYVEVTKDSAGKVNLHTEAVELVVPPASEIFDLERHDRLQIEERDMEKFITSLKLQAQEEGTNIVSEIETLMTYKDDVRDLALHYLSQAMDRKGG
jgi:DNA repair exonuclease SbcCD nuclease subunit